MPMNVFARLAAFFILLTAAALTVVVTGVGKDQAPATLADLLEEGSSLELADVEPLEPEPIVAGDTRDEIISE